MGIDLSGQIAVVTGGSGELGRVIVRTLARCGADVAIHYHENWRQAEALAKELDEMGRHGLVVQADVTDFGAIVRMRDEIVASLGAPTIVVNNAVIQYQWTSVLAQDVEDYESQFRSCVMHNVFMAKAFVPAMVEARYGRVIAINTECAMQNAPTQSAYVAGKRGMDGVLRVLAKEVGPYNVTVNQVAPGWTITEQARRQGTQRQADYEAAVPLRRRGEDQEIANVVAFLASDLASYITGAYVPVCGGNVMPAI
ncbi:MAG TPA: SDR family oxidoreductase [Chloroflexi bacterium]|nr:SDR family oxidoreductase [Chloroflexota bacterium]